MAEWERVEQDDPERCQSVDGQGQCPYKAIPPSNHCPRHGANRAVATTKNENIRNYNLGKWRARVNEFADNPKVKSLREEIGIMRMMLEEILLRCNDSADLVLYNGKISDMIVKIQKLVESCHKLEERTGVLLDKQAIIVVCDSIVKIIGEKIEDPDALNDIACRMVDVVAKIGGLNNVLANASTPTGAN